MNQSYKSLFDEKEIIEENKLQTVLMGSKKNAPEQKVIIHKFKIGERFNHGFTELIDTLQHKLHIEEDKEHIILVSKHLEGDNISLHLNFSNITEQERLDYLYEYLHQAVAYIGFDHFLFNTFISSNQVVFIDHKLYLREQLVLDRRYNDEMPFSMVSKNIGQVLQRLLITNYSELRTSKKYDALHQFTESLIRREKEYKCFDDLFSDFKAIYFTKSKTTKHVLLGDSHPNNMFLDQTQDMPFIPEPPEEEDVDQEETPVQEIIINSEVTEEERAILTGPIEESIDLSKLTESISSLDDLLVKDEEEIIEDVKPVEEEKEVVDPEAPTYGVPTYFKGTKKEEPTKQKKSTNIDWKLPLLGLAGVLLIIFTIWGLSKVFAPDNSEPLPPEALFTIAFEGDTLICTNESTAHGDAYIVQSLWHISRDGVLIKEIAGANKADFKATNMKEGEYSVKLTVTDSNTLFSDPYTLNQAYLSDESRARENQKMTQEELSSTQRFSETDTTSEEIIDMYITSSTENVSFDQTVKKDGNKSFLIDLTEDAATLSFDQLDIPAGSTVSFWMMTNKSENISVDIQGYNNGFLNYNKTVSTNSADVLDWSVVSLQMNVDEETDNIVFRFPQNDMNIWFDDLTVRSFK